MSLFEDYKLKEIELDKSKKHHVDMYAALRRIGEENDSIVLAIGWVDIRSEFSMYRLQDMIHDLDLARYFESYDDWCENSLDPTKLDLKKVLDSENIDYRDFDGELIDLITENDISLEDWLYEFSYLTEDGKRLLEDLSWIEIYIKYIPEFDFDDYYYFISNRSGTIKDNTLKYLDEHLIVAKMNDDEQYITHCEASKTLVDLLWNKPVEFSESSSNIMEKFDNYVQNKRNARKEQEDKSKRNNPPIQISEIDFCKMADNKYRLVPREDDSYRIPVRLKQFEYYKSVEEFNDADLALHDLSFVPWCFREGLRDASFEEGFLTHRACKENWHVFSKDLSSREMREFLESHGKDSSGTKKNLIQKIVKSDLPLEEFVSEKTFLSKKAYDFFKEYEWIQFYLDNMFYFDFLDFEDYLINHSGSFEEIALNYLDEHIVIAHKSLDFEYIINAYGSKSVILHEMGNLDDALACDMRILHLNMNPICLDERYYFGHVPLVPENISFLKEDLSEFGEDGIFKSFEENWNFMGFNSLIIPKEEVWKYLITALNSKAQNHGSRKIREKFFMNFSNGMTGIE